jgi:maltooligosyltrehalose trehalohydrolase
LPPTAFVSFLQNHDQIGNRPRGERLDALASENAIEAALAVMLLAPMPPLMFMGEEWGTQKPFPFFCDFSGELADAVRKGRRAEFKEAYRHQKEEGEIPDPLAEATFRSAVLDWAARAQPKHRRRLDLVTRLIAARCRHVIPRLAGLSRGGGQAEWAGDVLTASWRLNGGTLALLANLSDAPAPRPVASRGAPIWNGPAPARLPPWSVYWTWSEG